MNVAHPNVEDRRTERIRTALIVLASVVPFLPTLAFGYVLDDTYSIRGNLTLRSGWDSLWRVWTEQFGGERGPFTGLYRPIPMTLFAFLFNAGGRWPLWFHLMAVVAHAAASVAVLRLLLYAVPRTPAMLLALWFAVHPVHVEAVANVTSSTEILVALWTCGLAAYLWRIANAGRQATPRDAVLAGALYIGAAFSKESGIMAAPIALLFAWGWHAPARTPAADVRIEWRRWKAVVGAFAVVVIVVALTRALVLGGPVTGEPIAAIALEGMNGWQRTAAMLAIGPKILELLFWPVVLNPQYGPSTFPASTAAIGVRALVTLSALLTATIVCLRAVRHDGRWLVGLAWTLLAFFPASNLLVPTGQVLAERTLYVPSIGIAMLLALVGERVSLRLAGMRHVARFAALAAVLVVLAVFAVRSANGAQVWRGHAPLFAQMIAADTAGYEGYWQSGVEATLQARPTEALAFYQQAYARYKRDRGLILDLGAALQNQGDFARAVEVYREGLKLAPGDSALTARLAALGVK